MRKKDQNYESILDKIEAKEPEVFYACGNWSLYKDGYMDAKREISDMLKAYFRYEANESKGKEFN